MQSAKCKVQSTMCKVQSTMCKVQSTMCKVQSTKCKVQSAKCNIETSGIMQSTKRGAKLQSKGIIRTKAKFWYIPLHSFSVLCSFLIDVSLV